MCLGVFAVYAPVPAAPGQNTLFGSDYLQLHARRIRYAQESIFSGDSVPAWYSRELMGTPFWSNVQNFPLIPTRLPLLVLDPLDGFAAGVIIAAILAAMFTFLLCRRLGMLAPGAAVAGWTFACAGFFACRVTAGHLPLLEAYPLLPLWLWLAEACRQSLASGRRGVPQQAALAFAGLCGALAGHPQLPLYAAVVTGLYLLYRGPLRTALRLNTVLGLGMACGAFVLWPMLSLIRRSTRVLALDPATNDVSFPYGRLGALLLPWKDGWPEAALAAQGRPFTGYPNDAYFWDTVCYVGWLPLAAAVFLLVRAARRRERPPAPALFFAAAGVLALLTALPVVQEFVERIPGTILRSPARHVYVTTFALALAAGAGVHVVAARASRIDGGPHLARLVAALVLALLLVTAHAIDLGAHARAYIRMVAVEREGPSIFEDQLRQAAGDGRVAIDYELAAPFVRAIDDVGVFDSLLLARSYATLLDLAGLPPGHNVQSLNGSELNARALASTGVRLVVTTRPRPDLELLSGDGPLRVYGTRDAAPRAAFLPTSQALSLTAAETRGLLRDPHHDLRRHVIVPPGEYGLPAPATTPAGLASPAAVEYRRGDSDEIVVRVQANEPGFLRVLESWDPGWSATVNEMPVDVVPADGAFMAVALPPGGFEVRFRYATYGTSTGIGISLASLCLLAAMLAAGRRRATGDSPVGHAGSTPADAGPKKTLQGTRRRRP